MKQQSSLEVPKQVRSASFDEIQLGANRPALDLLTVPSVPNERSKSFDASDTTTTTSNSSCCSSSSSAAAAAVVAATAAAASRLEVPSVRTRFQRRRSSSEQFNCVHCVCVAEYEAAHRSITTSITTSFDTESSEDDDDDDDEDEPDDPPCSIQVNLEPPGEPADLNQFLARRRSIIRQEAFFCVEPPPPTDTDEGASTSAYPDNSTNLSIPTAVHDIFLKVPDLKRDRAASVDSCFSTKPENPNGGGDGENENCSPRSKSVDIVLPTEEQARYKALALSSHSAYLQQR